MSAEQIHKNKAGISESVLENQRGFFNGGLFDGDPALITRESGAESHPTPREVKATRAWMRADSNRRERI